LPEGHTIHRLARDHRPLLVGRTVAASSPQGRFTAGAQMLDGRTVESIHPYGKPRREVPERIWDQMWEDLEVLLRAGVRAGHIVTTHREDRDRRSGSPRREDRCYVYRRHGLPCRQFGTEVRAEQMAGRNLYWCPVCQPA
jgi:formamidopyrimidine-DNA glycosylase